MEVYPLQRKVVLLLFLALIVLVIGQVMRYEQLAYSPTVHRYLDRWTGIEWVKTYTWDGLSRYPAKFYTQVGAIGNTDDAVLKEIKRMQTVDEVLTHGWYVAVCVLSLSLVNSMIKLKGSKSS